MIKLMVEKIEYKLCEKCGVHRNPAAFKVKKQKRKTCSNCRTKRERDLNNLLQIH